MPQKLDGAYIFIFITFLKHRCKLDMWEARCMGNDPWLATQDTSMKWKYCAINVTNILVQ